MVAQTVSKLVVFLPVMLVLALVFGGGVAQAQSGDGQLYVVQHDDTLWKLAHKYLGNGNRFDEILAATRARHAQDPTFSGLTNPNLIHAGAKLWIPAAGSPINSTGQPAPPVSAPASVGPDIPRGKIAFSFWNDSPARCTYEINIIDVAACATGADSCQAGRRIFALNNASEPALSPDGNRLAFRGWGGIPEKYNNNQQDHPYFNCPGPQAQRQLGHTSLDGTDYFRATRFWEDSHPDWSPDGGRILFDTARNGDGITRIMAVSADGRREDTLRLNGQQPSWAPDSDRFVFRGCDLTGNRCGLWLARALPVEAWDVGVNLLGPLVQDAPAAQPDWSPAGEQIVYQSPANGSWDLFVINADGTGQRALVTTPAVEGLPAFSPDGQWVAYLSNADGVWGIWVVRADGRDARQIFAFDGGIFTPLAVPPYGQRDWIDEQISWSK